MKYTLDTLPVLDAYQAQCECPLCRLQVQCEDQYVDSLLSSAYMEPECRIQTNEIGFCTRHFEMMYHRRNRLGLALMTHTHMQQIMVSLEQILSPGYTPRSGLFDILRNANLHQTDKAQAIRARLSGCMICDQVDSAVERYAYTIAQLYITNAEFRQTLVSSKGFCLPHFALMLHMASNTLSSAQSTQLQRALAALELENMARMEKELEWFTLKYDYRNQDKPWGTSRDAVERAINKLMGVCVGEDAQLPPHND